MRGAVFNAVNLEETDFTGADVTGADFTNSYTNELYLTDKQIASAIGITNTRGWR